MASTVPLTGSVLLPDGTPLPNGQLRFQLTATDSDQISREVFPGGGLIVIDLIDGEIPAGTEIWRNTAGLRGTAYQIYQAWTDQDGRMQQRHMGLRTVGDAASYTYAGLIDADPPETANTYSMTITADEYQQALAARDGAGESATLSAAYAQTPEDTTVPGGAGYSALHYAAKAGADAAAADAARELAEAAVTNAQAAALTVATWTALAALTAAVAGTGAEVLDTDTGTHTDPVAGGTVNNAGRYSWSVSPAGWRRIGVTGLAAKADRAVTNVRDLFPGRDGSGITAIELAAFARTPSVKFFNVPAGKVVIEKYLFWKDVGTRFNITFQIADDANGTNAVDACSYAVASGADMWTGWREITMAAVGGSGVTGTVQINFDDTTAILMNTPPTTAAMYQRRQVNPSAIQTSAAQAAYLNAAIAAGVTPLLPSGPGQRKPWRDNQDATGTVFTNAFLRAFVKGAWVYGPKKSSNIRISYMRLSNSATCYIDLYDDDKGRLICRWSAASVLAFAAQPRFVAAVTVPNLLTYSGEWAVLELDWTAISATIEGPLSTMQRGGLHEDCLHSFEDCQWWATSPVFHETINVGATRTRTTITAAPAPHIPIMRS